LVRLFEKILSAPDRIAESGTKKQEEDQPRTKRYTSNKSRQVYKYSYEPGFHFLFSLIKDQRLNIQQVFVVERNLTCPELEGWLRTEREISQGWTPASDL